MNKAIGDVISEHRKEAKLSQIDLAERLTEKGFPITNAGISAWEKGNTIPTTESFLAVCELLQINDIYTEFIGENSADPFKNLNTEGKKKVLEYIDLLEKSGEYEKKDAEIIDITPRLMKVALVPASAGNGNFLDDENFEMMEFNEPVPKKADFGVYLDGNSMEPKFHDEELVWIEQTDFLNSGDFGLFFLDGMTYFKKYVVNTTGTFLVSLNPTYAPKQIGEFSTFKIFGKLATE